MPPEPAEPEPPEAPEPPEEDALEVVPEEDAGAPGIAPPPIPEEDATVDDTTEEEVMVDDAPEEELEELSMDEIMEGGSEEAEPAYKMPKPEKEEE
jgi:hypothetical protein